MSGGNHSASGAKPIRGRDQRDGMSDRKRRHDQDERAQLAPKRHDEAEQEQQVIGAVQDVLEAERARSAAATDASADRADTTPRRLRSDRRAPRRRPRRTDGRDDLHAEPLEPRPSANSELAEAIGASNSTSSSACCHGSCVPSGSGGAVHVRERRIERGERAVARNRRARGDERERRERCRPRRPRCRSPARAAPRCAAPCRRARRRDSPGRTSETRCPASPRAARARGRCRRSPGRAHDDPHGDIARNLVPRARARPQARTRHAKHEDRTRRQLTHEVWPTFCAKRFGA